MSDERFSNIKNITQYYDSIYYENANKNVSVSNHLRRLAVRIGIQPGQRVLDVACGKGEWLLAVQERGAIAIGIDLSAVAIDICKLHMPSENFVVGPAEALPFEDGTFDVISCLGSLEHFIDPLSALQEMVRVSREGARFVLLVLIDGFLLRRLGLYKGTRQTAAREEVRSLGEWQRLFEEAGLVVKERSKDLHVISWSWINMGPLYLRPCRAALALSLAVWPLEWQYQVHHTCELDRPDKRSSVQP